MVQTTVIHKKILNFAVALVVSATIVSCKDKIETISGVDVSSLPSEEVKNMKVLYTEDGVIKYDFMATEVKHYQYADIPYYNFPAGIHWRSYIADTVIGIAVANADIVADSAVYIERPEFYEAYRNVVARNLLINQRIETDTMFYDPLKQDKAIYSYSRSVIFRPPDTIPATKGFFTDTQFKMYELVKVLQGTVFFTMSPDSTATNHSDTVHTNTPTPANEP